MVHMNVALTGTPGTGKTSIAEELDSFNVLDLKKFVKDRDIGDQKKEFEVNTEEMVKHLREEVNSKDNVLIEGHLSHHFSADFCVVLRCNPEELRERLSKRDYSEDKIEENIESEILDVILSEAVEKQENIIEVDTTGKEPKEVAKEIEDKIENRETGYGEIDWTGYL